MTKHAERLPLRRVRSGADKAGALMTRVRRRLESIGSMLCIGIVLVAWADPPAPPTDSSASPKSASASGPANTFNPQLEEGVAVVQACVDEKGTLTRDPVIVQSSGSRRLDEDAIRIAKSGSGHYQPPMSDGKAVPGCISFKVRFQVKDSPADHASAPSPSK